MAQSEERPERRGRPRVERDPNERISLSVRLRGEVFNDLSAAAREHDWPLGREIEGRLERSLAEERDLFDPRWRHMARRLIGFYLLDGPAGVIRLLTRLPDPRSFEEPDLAEKRRRFEVMREQLEKSVFAETDSVEAAQALMEERTRQVTERVESHIRAKLAERKSPTGDSQQ